MPRDNVTFFEFVLNKNTVMLTLTLYCHVIHTKLIHMLAVLVRSLIVKPKWFVYIFLTFCDKSM